MVRYTGKNNVPTAMNINSFVGYNTVDDPSNLGKGYLVAGSKNIDLARERGSLGKALGRAALITSLGAGGVKGLHAYQKSSGDIPLLGWSTLLYKLSGSSLTATKTSAAEFNAGTHYRTRTNSDTVILNAGDTSLAHTADQSNTGGTGETGIGTGHNFGQTFTTGSNPYNNNISKISLNAGTSLSWVDGDIATLKLYTSTAKTTELGSVVVNGPQSSGYVDFIFPLPISVSPSTQYYVEVAVSGGSGISFRRSTTDTYAGGAGYYDGTVQTYDWNFNTYSKGYYATGVYTSAAIDLGQTPLTSVLTWSETVPANTDITFSAIGSADGTNWGDAQSVLSGGATPRMRYIKVIATLTTTDTLVTPTLSDFTLTYTTAYDTGIPLKTGLAGNTVRGCNYQDNFFFTDGGRPKRYDGTLHAVSINGTFESATTGWTGAGNHSISRITSDYHSGTACMQVVASAAGSGSGNNVTCGAAGVATNSCEVTFWAKSVSGNTSLFVTYEGLASYGQTFIITTSWAQYTLRHPTGATPTLYMWLGGAGTFLVDDVVPQSVGIFDVGIDPPLTAPSGAQGSGTGIGAGTYLYQIAYLNDIGGESARGPASAGVTIVANKSIDLTSIPVSPSSSVTSREIYRTKAGGTSYFYVATIANNTATTYTDTTNDTALVTPPEDDVGLPPLDATIVYEHKNYMMYASGDKVYFSKVGEPDHVSPVDYKQFPGNVLAMRSFQGALVVGGDNFCHAVFGDIWDSSPTVDDTTVKVVSNTFGPVSQESMCLCNSSIGDILVFPTRRGLNYVNQGFQENTVVNSLLSAEVQNMFDGAINRSNMAGMYFNYEYLLAMDYYGAETPVTTNNILMKYDLRGNKWNPPITYGLNGICEASGMLLGASSTAGIVYQLNSGYTDAGSNIHAIAKLSPLTAPAKSKFSRARVRVNDGSTTDTLELKPSVDGAEGTIAVGATSTWSVATVSPKFHIPCPRGYEMQMKIEDDSTNDWILPVVEIDYEGGVL